MKDRILFFRHECNSRNDQKILKIRTRFGNAEAYGMYWFLIESMYETSDGYISLSAIPDLALSYSLDAKRLQEFVEYCIEIGLVDVKKKSKISTERVLEGMKSRDERSASGRKGAYSKWNRLHGSANSSATSSANGSADANKRKENKTNKYNNHEVNYICGFGKSHPINEACNCRKMRK